MQAKDLMTADVVAVAPEATVEGVARQLVEHRISAVPVVADDGSVVGIVSEGDLLRRRELGTERRASWWLEIFADPDSRAHAFSKAHGLTAGDVMSEPAITVEETASIAEIAALLERHGIKRVPVLRGGKLVGIVSRADLVRVFAGRAAAAPRGAPADDRAIEERLRHRMRAESWSRSGQVNVVVRGGTVELWGFARSEEQRQALKVLARETPGVEKVEDHLTVAAFTDMS